MTKKTYKYNRSTFPNTPEKLALLDDLIVDLYRLFNKWNGKKLGDLKGVTRAAIHKMSVKHDRSVSGVSKKGVK